MVQKDRRERKMEITLNGREGQNQDEVIGSKVKLEEKKIKNSLRTGQVEEEMERKTESEENKT